MTNFKRNNNFQQHFFLNDIEFCFEWITVVSCDMILMKSYMSGITQEVHPYKPNVTKSCAKQAFSWGHFFKELRESFCVISLKSSVPRICKNIFKKVS